jgi:DNA-binding NarL/FixJ family response regulator
VTRIVIVEDHLLLAETLRATLGAQGIDAAVVPPLAPAELVDAVQELKPELVLLDLDLGAHGDSTTVIAPLAAHGIRVLVVSGTSDRERIGRALEAGAFGYHCKASSFDALVAKTTSALTSRAPLDADLRRELAIELAEARAARSRIFAPFARLTDREQDTLRALSTGLSVHNIAQQWVVSEATVRSHVRGVLTKLDAPSQLAAVALAARTGWLAATA